MHTPSNEPINYSIHYHVPGMFTFMPLSHDVKASSEEEAKSKFRQEVPDGKIIHISHDIPPDIRRVVNERFMDFFDDYGSGYH